MSANEKIWAVVPAAGSGRRFSEQTPDRAPDLVPKQYLDLHGRAMIEHSLGSLLQLNELQAVYVALHPEDQHFARLDVALDQRVRTLVGGVERVDSVHLALAAMAGEVKDNDWVMVHDAARPCLPFTDLQLLLQQAREQGTGAILATPVVDTLKRASIMTGEIIETVDRQHLWRALTPQVFRYGVLKKALTHCCQHSLLVTDEASAVEQLGLSVLLVPGNSCNIKVTYPSDVPLAEYYLLKEQMR